MFTKYNILIILCSPVLLLLIIRIYDKYKSKKISRRGFFIQFIFWMVLVGGIILNKQLFNYLETIKVIDSTPLSLYDVVQITAIIFLIYLFFRLSSRTEELQNKLTRLNREVALSDVKKNSNE